MPGSGEATAPDAAGQGALLARIEASAAFRGSPRHRALLRHLAARAQAGDTAALKESVIAVEVFGRAPGAFDPRADSIVRVETRRLRARLARYVGGEGRGDAWQLVLPVGSYVPLWLPRAATPPQHAAEASRRARDLVERGEHFLRQPLSRGTLEAARERFDAALRESPDHAPAHVALARAWLNLATGGYRHTREATEHAAEALRRALALAPDDAVAHALLGAVQHQHERDWPAARRSFERALALAPQQAFVHSAYGAHLVMRGDAERAEAVLQRARALDAHYVNARMHMVNLRVLQGRHDQASLELEAFADLAPDSLAVAGLRGLLALLQGESAAAVAHYRRALALAPGLPAAEASLAAALAADGQADAADALLRPLLARRIDTDADADADVKGDAAAAPHYVLAIAELRRGRPDAAAARLHRALDERDPSAVMLPIDPSFAALRAHPAWPALVHRARSRA